MSLKIEDLKVGDDLECIDDNYAFKTFRNKIGLELKVTRIYEQAFKLGDYVFNSSDIKYFKKKEQSQYTFDDLIDIAYRAYRDGVFSEISIDKSSFTTIGCIGWHQYFLRDRGVIRCHKGVDIVESIDLTVAFIQSLYKETFVIESIEQMNKITFKQDAKITLSNGEVLHESVICSLSKFDNDVAFCVLKGATVEQKRLFA